MKNLKLTKRDIQLIYAIRKLQFGRIEIIVRDGQVQPIIAQKEKKIDITKIEPAENVLSP